MTDLITDDYKELLAWEHANTPGKWGQTAKMYVNTIVAEAEDHTNWLDYGAGHGGLGIAIKEKFGDTYTINEYEPSRPDSALPDPCEYVVCIDVLEHIEPDLIDNVLDDLQRVTVDKGYFTISCRLAAKILKDGRNAHLIVEQPEWWLPKLKARFRLLECTYASGDKNLRVSLEHLDGNRPIKDLGPWKV